MGKSIVGTTSRKSIPKTFFYSVLACIVAVITLMVNSSSLTGISPISQFFQVTQGVIEKLADIIQFNPILITPLIAVVAIALKLKKKVKNSKTPSEIITAYYKPRKTPQVENPANQRLKIVALAPVSYFSELVKRVYNETNDVYGDVPLWVRYSMNTVGYSWSLNNVKASHDINVYGESTYVQRFLSRLNEELQTLQKNAPTNIINVHSIESEGIQEEQNHPKEIKKALKKQGNTALLNGLSLFAIALLTLLASNAWKNKHATNGDSPVGDERALQNALKAVRQLGIKDQELKAQRRCDDGWMFQFTDYEVFVNRQGMVMSIRRCVK